jgi:hypothetical protein
MDCFNILSLPNTSVIICTVSSNINLFSHRVHLNAAYHSHNNFFFSKLSYFCLENSGSSV